MAVTTAGEEEHAAIFCPIVLTSIFFKSYSRFCGMECRELHALKFAIRDISHTKM